MTFSIWQHAFKPNETQGGFDVFCTKSGALLHTAWHPTQDAVLEGELAVYLEFRKEYFRAKYEREMNEIWAVLQDKRGASHA
jgi:hypothetical protein